MKNFLKCYSLILVLMLLFSFQIVKADGGQSYIIPGKKVETLINNLPKEYTKTEKGKCLKFVSNLWKKADPDSHWPSSSCCAYKDSLKYGKPDTVKNGKIVVPPPIGAFVYYKDIKGNVTSHNGHNCEHVAIYIGNKEVMHAFGGKVRIHNIENIPDYQLTSWGYPMGVEVERIPDNAYELSINLTSYPTKLSTGSSYGLRGTITSGYKIDKISAMIINRSKVMASIEQKTNSFNINIADSFINTKLKFAKLPSSSTPYTLIITAHDTSGKTATISKNFLVTSFDINLTTIPGTLTAGKSFGLRGDITSINPIKTVRGYIKTTDGTIKFLTTDTPNTKSMNIKNSNLNNNLKFARLPVGSYVLEIKALDSKGNIKTIQYNFNVKK